MKSIAVHILVCVLVLTSGPATARGIRTSPLTDEQRARNADEALRQTPLKIGPNCEPKSFTTKVWLKTLNEAEMKYFWLGQKFAVERTYREGVQAERLGKMNDDADRRIAAIDQQRDAANFAAMGIRPYNSPEIDRVNAETTAFLAKLTADRERSDLEWARRCQRYTDDRTK